MPTTLTLSADELVALTGYRQAARHSGSFGALAAHPGGAIVPGLLQSTNKAPRLRPVVRLADVIGGLHACELGFAVAV